MRRPVLRDRHRVAVGVVRRADRWRATTDRPPISVRHASRPSAFNRFSVGRADSIVLNVAIISHSLINAGAAAPETRRAPVVDKTAGSASVVFIESLPGR